jgi:hypothetical protein
MTREYAVVRSIPLTMFALLTMLQLCSCGFSPNPGSICYQYTQTPIVPLTIQTSHTVFETPGTVIAIHGSGGAKAGNAHRALRVQQSVSIPDYANQATVFLNGWKAEYLGGDQHVLALGTVITEIHADVTKHTLSWNALGILRDDDGDEDFEWLYNFTVVAWNDANLKAFVDHGALDSSTLDCDKAPELTDNYFYASNSGTSTALSCFFSFLQNTGFNGSKQVAVVPRGFGFVYNDGDHHLLQLHYNLDHSEVFAQRATNPNQRVYNKQGNQVPAPLADPGKSQAGAGFVSWSPYAILKDNGDRKDYTFAEVVSGMGGEDVGVIQPPYGVLPSDSSWSCAYLGSAEIVIEDHEIDDIAYEFAIPMLTGWDLEYVCSDQHVKGIGMWILDWKYEPPTNTVGGKLHYRLASILRDDDNKPPFGHSHKVSVLGLKPVSVSGGGDGIPVKGKPKSAKTLR